MPPVAHERYGALVGTMRGEAEQAGRRGRCRPRPSRGVIATALDREAPAHALRDRPRREDPGAAGARAAGPGDGRGARGRDSIASRLLNNRDDCGTIMRMSATARFQVLLASLCFGTTGTAQALGPDGLAPAGRRRRRGSSSAAACSSSSRCSPAVVQTLARLPRRPLADRRRRGRDLPALVLRRRRRHRRRGRARSSRSAPRPRWRAGSSGRSSAARPTRAWAMATALACAGVAMLALAGADAAISLPGVAARARAPAPPTPATRSPPSGC